MKTPPRISSFLRVLVFAVLLGSMPVLRAAPAGTTLPSPRRNVIDSHLHFSAEKDFIQRVVAIYRARQAMACVLTPMSGFETVRQAAADFPDVVIPYGRIEVDSPAAAAEIERFAAAGFKGIKMHMPRHNWDDPRYFPLYELIAKHHLVALFHTGISAHPPGNARQHTSMARMRPAYLDTLSREFPNLPIQGAHLGNPWYEEAAEAARWAPNLYFDLTGSTLIKKKDELGVFKKIFWWEGPGLHSSPDTVYAFEKIVFGTDEAPENFDIVLARYEAMLDACGVPEVSRRKIFGETMARLLGLPQKPAGPAK
jgi:predicted TIM-barrel fold metal-dependent hydrolase